MQPDLCGLGWEESQQGNAWRWWAISRCDSRCDRSGLTRRFTGCWQALAAHRQCTRVP